MSYYTNYTLTVWKYPEEVDFDALSTAVLNIDNGAFEERGIDEWGCLSTWYSQDVDMWELSVQFPQILFRLHGEGESADDLWDEYWQNGSFQHCHEEIPPFDRAKMQSYERLGDRLRLIRPEDEVKHSNIKLPDF